MSILLLLSRKHRCKSRCFLLPKIQKKMVFCVDISPPRWYYNINEGNNNYTKVEVRKMTTLKNAFGETYYMTEETKGNDCGTEYTEIYLYSEELGEKYGTHYRNAVNDSQPNIWTPYKITDKKLIIYNDYTKTRYYMYDIVK